MITEITQKYDKKKAVLKEWKIENIKILVIVSVSHI